MSKLRVACTALGKRIVVGRLKRNGIGFTGEPQDVTSDVLKAVIDKVGVGYEVDVHVEGVPKFRISVAAIPQIEGENNANPA